MIAFIRHLNCRCKKSETSNFVRWKSCENKYLKEVRFLNNTERYWFLADKFKDLFISCKEALVKPSVFPPDYISLTTNLNVKSTGISLCCLSLLNFFLPYWRTHYVWMSLAVQFFLHLLFHIFWTLHIIPISFNWFY